jgi:hypothetical protein
MFNSLVINGGSQNLEKKKKKKKKSWLTVIGNEKSVYFMNKVFFFGLMI